MKISTKLKLPPRMHVHALYLLRHIKIASDCWVDHLNISSRKVMAFSTSCLDKTHFPCPLYFFPPKKPLINCLVLCFLCWDTKEEFIERAWNSYPIFSCHRNHRKGQALLLPFSNMDRNTDEKMNTIRLIKIKVFF